MTYDISNDIRYIGVDDKTIDLFEGKYAVPEGVSYNSYLILDEKVAVMDTADARKTGEWLANLRLELSGRTPDYVIVHHAEPDHAASLLALVREYPSITVVSNAKTFALLTQFYDHDFSVNSIAVKEGDSLSLGRHCLNFIAAPMVHWPEVIVSYESSEKVLFSADGFGKFGALDVDDEWDCEARRYYFNIVGKYGAQVQALLKKAASLDIRTIAPLHGPILRENLGHYLSQYDTWSSYRPETEGVFIAYASIYGNTAKAAQALATLLRSRGVKVAVTDLARDDRAEALEDAFRYSRMVLAASTYDGGIFTPMADFIHDLEGKGYRNRRVGLIENGSWAPMSGKKMCEAMESLKDVTVCGHVVTLKSGFKSSDQASLELLADEIMA